MGSGYCMALGAKVAKPDRQVLSTAGMAPTALKIPKIRFFMEGNNGRVSKIFTVNPFVLWILGGKRCWF